MAIYHVTRDGLKAIPQTTFAHQGIRERNDLQRLLRDQIQVLAPDTLVIAEEFGEWEDSRRRIDLLAIDKEGNLVVIELKRTEDGGYMDLQAIRYAAMVSVLTFERVVSIYQEFLERQGKQEDSREKILDFLGQDEPDEDNFAQDVRIVLASAEFSKELTTAVMWLNDYGLDIRCVRLHPYKDGERTLLDIQTVIPLPEAEAYQIQLREKQQKEREARHSTRDFTHFDLFVGDRKFSDLSKRAVMFFLVRELIVAGVGPDQIKKAVVWRQNNLFAYFPGELTEAAFVSELMKTDSGGKLPRYKRFFCKEDELFRVDGVTYALSNQWGNRTLEAAKLIAKAFPGLNINVKETAAN